jgi:hypothetical protein
VTDDPSVETLAELYDSVRGLMEDRDEYEEVFKLWSPLMRRTANALKGEPPPLHSHDLSDLPVVAAAIVAERDALRAVLRRALKELPVPPSYGPGSVWNEMCELDEAAS